MRGASEAQSCRGRQLPEDHALTGCEGGSYSYVCVESETAKGRESGNILRDACMTRGPTETERKSLTSVWQRGNCDGLQTSADEQDGPSKLVRESKQTDKFTSCECHCTIE